MKYLLKNLYYSNDKVPTLFLMEDVNGIIKYKDVFTNMYYPTDQVNVIGNFLSIIKSNNLDILITDINGEINYYADIDKLKYILKILTAQKSLPKNVEMKSKNIGNQVAEHVTNLSGLDPKDSKVAIKASKLDLFKKDLSCSASISLRTSNNLTITGISPMFLKAIKKANILKENLNSEFTVVATLNGVTTAKNNFVETKKHKPDFQLLLRRQK